MIRAVTRKALPAKFEILVRIIAVVAAIAASMIIMLCMKFNPFVVYANILKGSLGSGYRFCQTVNKAIPLTVLSLGTGIAFKMKFWNIGGEGQFFMGAFGAALAAFAFPSLPAPLLLTLMALVAFIFGGLWALIPAGLKTKWGTSETLVTLMLNYIAQKWVGYLQYGPWRDPQGNGFPQVAKFAANAILPKVFGIHVGWIITLVLAAIVFFLIKKTKFGYEIQVIGESTETARYAGINVSRVMILAVFLSGGLCALAGMMNASAIENTISEKMSGGIGFTAVITTWLAQLDPLVMVIVSFLFSMLIQGGSFLQSSMQIPASMSSILQGIIIFFVLGSEFFVKYKLFFAKRAKKNVIDTNTAEVAK